jgi:galactokinase
LRVSTSGAIRRAFAPGRVNLIGDHTDHTGGFALPMAIHLGTTVSLDRGGDTVTLRSADDPSPAIVPLDGRVLDRLTTPADPADGAADRTRTDDGLHPVPAWTRYVAAVVAEVRPTVGGAGMVTTTLPIGAGLSSSAALEVALALALGYDGSPMDLALLCQRAEHAASGVPCGVMDQLTSAAGVAGHALLLDCTTLSVTPVRLPDGVEVVAVHSGLARALAGTAYAERRAACDAAAAVVGPLRDADLASLAAISDPVVRRRARHVVTENARTLQCADALRSGDVAVAGQLMDASHASLRDDFEVSTPELDAVVDRLRSTPGVFGARLTGAGFGGCAVALCEPGARTGGWRLTAVDGARLLEPG